MTVEQFLSQRMTAQLEALMIEKEYTVILGEAVSEWVEIPLCKCDLRLLLAERMLSVASGGQVRWQDAGYEGVFFWLREILRGHEVVLEDGKLRVGLFTRKFKNLKKVMSFADTPLTPSNEKREGGEQ